jgi:hypothetical protein
LHLAPASTAGGPSVCTDSTAGCRGCCLDKQGRGGIWSKATGEYTESTKRIHRARARKTRAYHRDRAAFLRDLRADIQSLARYAAGLGKVPAVRVNGTSDLPALALQLAADFPSIQFYDYTKHAKAWFRARQNYHVTFSRSESNEADCRAHLARGVNVAVVFGVPKSAPLPATWWGHPVIDGDVSDLRFLDPTPCIVGLRAKGTAKSDRTGFVVRL